MSKRRRLINWKPDVPRDNILRPRTLVHEIEFYPENAHRAERLIPGSLWSVESDQFLLSFDARTTPPPFPYMVSRYGNGLIAAAGSSAVYLGTTRVEELGTSSLMVRVLRHTFLIGGLRYLATDLNCFAPV